MASSQITRSINSMCTQSIVIHEYFVCSINILCAYVFESGLISELKKKRKESVVETFSMTHNQWTEVSVFRPLRIPVRFFNYSQWLLKWFLTSLSLSLSLTFYLLLICFEKFSFLNKFFVYFNRINDRIFGCMLNVFHWLFYFPFKHIHTIYMFAHTNIYDIFSRVKQLVFNIFYSS